MAPHPVWTTMWAWKVVTFCHIYVLNQCYQCLCLIAMPLTCTTTPNKMSPYNILNKHHNAKFHCPFTWHLIQGLTRPCCMCINWKWVLLCIKFYYFLIFLVMNVCGSSSPSNKIVSQQLSHNIKYLHLKYTVILKVYRISWFFYKHCFTNIVITEAFEWYLII